MAVKSPYTLLVIDMQRYFRAARKTKTLAACQRVIRKALADKAHVMFVEYAGCGVTSPTLTKVIDAADQLDGTVGDRWHVVKKTDDDGSAVVASHLRGLRLPHDHIKVVGVNTDICVSKTVKGLTRLLPKTKIEIIPDACNSEWATDHRYALQFLGNLKNVRIQDHV